MPNLYSKDADTINCNPKYSLQLTNNIKDSNVIYDYLTWYARLVYLLTNDTEYYTLETSDSSEKLIINYKKNLERLTKLSDVKIKFDDSFTKLEGYSNVKKIIFEPTDLAKNSTSQPKPIDFNIDEIFKPGDVTYTIIDDKMYYSKYKVIDTPNTSNMPIMGGITSMMRSGVLATK
jgi:hypothetical protein